MSCFTPGLSTAVARLTKGLPCCGPQMGEGSGYIIPQYTSLEVSPQIEETETPSKTLANGSICIPSRTKRFLSSVDITIDFCKISPEVFEVAQGLPPVVNYAGQAVGGRWSNRQLDLSGWALETWISEDSGTDCDPSGEGNFIYMLWPCLEGATLGEFTLDAENLFSGTLTSSTRPGLAWCRGPYDVQDQFEGDLVGGPLIEPLMEGDHGIWFRTPIAPPEPSCEIVELAEVDLGCESPAESP